MQKKHLDSSWVERSKNVLAQGYPATNSKRWTQFVRGVYPTHTSGHAYSCYLYDQAGNKYVDFIASLGALSLGHGNAKVTEYTTQQIRKGVSHSLPTTLEVEVAELICGLIVSAERVRFVKNGKDATELAARISRAYTGKKTIYTDGYHGCSDIWTSLTPPALGVVDQFHVKPITSEINWDDAACVIVEGLKLDDSDAYRKWLTELRAKARVHGAVFIMDEIITGFRVPQWTVSDMWGLDPDLVCIGKGMANGFPLSAVCGKKDLMDCGEYFYSTTFGGEAVSLAACRATIEEIHKRSLKDLMFYAKRFQSKLNALHPDIKFDGYGTRAMLNTTNPKTALFMQEACKAGFLFGKAFFFNFSHLEENIEQYTLSALQTIADLIQSESVKLEGELPEEPFRK